MPGGRERTAGVARGKKNRQFVECAGHNSARKTLHLHFVCAISDPAGRPAYVPCKYPLTSRTSPLFGKEPACTHRVWYTWGPRLARILRGLAIFRASPRTDTLYRGYLSPSTLFTTPVLRETFRNCARCGDVITKIRWLCTNREKLSPAGRPARRTRANAGKRGDRLRAITSARLVINLVRTPRNIEPNGSR